MFSLARGLFNKIIITESADGFVFHDEFSHGVNLHFTALLWFVFLRTLTFTLSYYWLLLWSLEKSGMPQSLIT